MEQKTRSRPRRRPKTNRKRWLEGAPKNVKDVYCRPQEIGSDTMLNILWRAEEGKREERKWKHIIDYIVLSNIIITNTVFIER